MGRRLRQIALSCLVLAVLFASTCTLSAQVNWIDPGGGTYSTGNNWSTGSAPLPSEQAHFGISGVANYTINFSTITSAELAYIKDDDVTFSFNFGSYSLTGDGANDSLLIGDVSSTAVLTIQTGTLSLGPGNDAHIGFAAGSTGTLTIGSFGTLGSLGGAPDVHLGGASSSQGTLSILSGGRAYARNAYIGDAVGGFGDVSVSGALARWDVTDTIYVGNNDDGDLNISNGGVVASVNAFLGRFTGAVGTAAVSGAGSRWENTNNLNVGSGSVGQLVVSNSGSVVVGGTLQLSNLGFFNIESNSTVSVNSFTQYGQFNFNDGTLTIDGGVFDNGGNDITLEGAGPTDQTTLILDNGATTTGIGAISVGKDRTGVLEIHNGSVFSNTSGVVGEQIGSDGLVVVDGAGSHWDLSAALIVGFNGQGTLSITNGGLVTTSNTAVEGDNGNTGTVTVSGAGSLWMSSASLTIGVGGPATLDILAGGEVSSGNARIAQGSTSSASVDVDGVGSLWTSSSLTVGESGNGSFSVTNGATASTGLMLVGDNASGSGTVIVDGSGSTWNATSVSIADPGVGDITISNFAQAILSGTWTQKTGGTLSILSGGSLTIGNALIGTASGGGATASVLVDGNGSSWSQAGASTLTIGAVAGTIASLTIDNGADVTTGSGTVTVNATGTVDIGTATNDGSFTSLGDLVIDGGTINQFANGEILVDDSGTGAIENTIVVGGVGNGSVEIRAGGTLNTTGTSTIGSQAGSTGNVLIDGLGSEWAHSAGAYLTIGDFGDGHVVIQNKGVLQTGFAIVGREAASNSSVTVTGAGSVWNSSSFLNVGGLFGGAGTLNVQNGGAVVVGGDLHLFDNGLIDMALGGRRDAHRRRYGRPTRLGGATRCGGLDRWRGSPVRRSDYPQRRHCVDWGPNWEFRERRRGRRRLALGPRRQCPRRREWERFPDDPKWRGCSNDQPGRNRGQCDVGRYGDR